MITVADCEWEAEGGNVAPSAPTRVTCNSVNFPNKCVVFVSLTIALFECFKGGEVTDALRAVALYPGA